MTLSIRGLTNSQNSTVGSLFNNLRALGQPEGETIAQEIQRSLTELNEGIENATSLRGGAQTNLNNERTELESTWFVERSRRRTLRECIGRSSNLVGSLSARIDTLTQRRTTAMGLLARAGDASLTTQQRDQALTQARTLLGQRSNIGQDVFARAHEAARQAVASAPRPRTQSRPEAPPPVQLPDNTPDDIRTLFAELDNGINLATVSGNGTQNRIASETTDRPSDLNIVMSGTRRAVDAGLSGEHSYSGGVETRRTELLERRDRALALMRAGQFEQARALLGQSSNVGLTAINNQARDNGGRDADRLHTEAVQTADTMVSVVQSARALPGRAAYGVTLAMTGNTRLASLAQSGINLVGDVAELGGQLAYGPQSTDQALTTFRNQTVSNALQLAGSQVPGVAGDAVSNFGQNVFDQWANGQEINLQNAGQNALAETAGNAVRDRLLGRMGRGVTPLGGATASLTGHAAHRILASGANMLQASSDGNVVSPSVPLQPPSQDEVARLELARMSASTVTPTSIETPLPVVENVSLPGTDDTESSAMTMEVRYDSRGVTDSRGHQITNEAMTMELRLNPNGIATDSHGNPITRGANALGVSGDQAGQLGVTLNSETDSQPIYTPPVSRAQNRQLVASARPAERLPGPQLTFRDQLSINMERWINQNIQNPFLMMYMMNMLAWMGIINLNQNTPTQPHLSLPENNNFFVGQPNDQDVHVAFGAENNNLGSG